MFYTKQDGLPSLSTAYREIDAANDIKDLRLTAPHTNELGKLIIQNTTKIVEEKEKSAWSLKVDEIALEKRLRYNSKSNEIIGLCAQHTCSDDIIFTSSQPALNRENSLQNGSSLLATESCVFSLSSLGDKNYHGVPALSLPICTHQTKAQQKSIFEATLNHWEDLAAEKKLYLFNIATDGDSTRRSVLRHIRNSELNSPIYNELSSLKFMDFTVGM